MRATGTTPRESAATRAVPPCPHTVGIVQPVTVAHDDDPAPEGVKLVPVAADAEPTIFSIFLEGPGAKLNESWPGQVTNGSTFVGRVPLAQNAGTCCIVALQQQIQSGPLEMPHPSDDDVRRMREWKAKGATRFSTMIGDFGDGAIALVDFRDDEDVLIG